VISTVFSSLEYLVENVELEIRDTSELVFSNILSCLRVALGGSSYKYMFSCPALLHDGVAAILAVYTF
jgi:hypothetical protein